MAIDRTPRQAIMDGIRNAEERFHENDRIPSIQWPEMADKIIEALREAGYSFASRLTSDPDPFCAMVESGEEVTITRAGNPVAVVIPVKRFWELRNALEAREQSISG